MTRFGLGHNSQDGWIKVHRSIRDHWLVGFGHTVKPADPTRGAYSRNEAFQDLIMECNYKDGYVNNGGKKMLVKPGQLVGAVSWLADRWNWTPKTVRTFLDNLEKDGMIDRFRPDLSGTVTARYKGNQTGNQSSVISICNYSTYQVGDYIQGQEEGQSRGNQRAIEGQSRGNIYKEEEGKKGRKEEGKKLQLFGGLEFKEFEKQLLDACNGSLDNPVNCSGLLSLAEPQMWLEQGCDLQKDILPTLKAVGSKAHARGQRISHWAYFTKAVADAKKAREKGLTTFNEHGELESKAERIKRLVAEADAQLSKGVRR